MKNAPCFFFGLLAFALSCWAFIPVHAALASSQPYVTDHRVNFGTGNKYQAETDLHISGTGLPLSFRRLYNSQSSEVSVIGYGWSASLTERLNLTADTLHLVQADGRWVYFVNDGTDTWDNESGKKRSITLGSDGYRLTEPNGEVKIFDSDGRQLSHADTNGNVLTYTYADNQLTAIATNFGQTLSFNYIDGKLGSIVSPAGTINYGYDANDNLISVTRPDGSVVSYLYEDPNDVHNLTGVLNEENTRTLTVAYDSEDRVISSALAGGSEAITIAYPEILTRTVTDSQGAVSTYQLEVINGEARVQSFTGPGCSSCGTDSGSSYTYDSRQQVSSITDALGVITTYTYDVGGNRLSTTKASGTSLARTTTFIYTANNQVATITEPSVSNPGQNRITTNTYDERGNLLTRTVSGFAGSEAVAKITTYTYNDQGQVTSMDGPRTDVSDILTLTYYPNEASQENNRGRLHTIVNALGQTTIYGDYTPLGKPATITAPSGPTTTLSYDFRGNVLSRTTGGLTTAYAYDLASRLHTITLPGNRTLSYTYTGDRITTIADGQGNSINYTYESKGQRIGEEIRDPDQALTHALELTYDPAGNLSKRIYADRAEETFTYDVVRNPVGHIDPTGVHTELTHDALNRLSIVTEADATIAAAYTYDGDDNPVTVTDGAGHVTTLAYDDLGNLRSTSAPDTGLTIAVQDPAGNLLTRTDAENRTVSFVYDQLNRPVRQSYPGAVRDLLFTYDQGIVGRVSAIQEEESDRSFAYDSLSRLTKETRMLGGTTSVIGYGYDAVTGELASMTYPSGRVLGFSRDLSGRVTGLTLDGASLATDIHYLPFGPMHHADVSDITLSRSFDQRYQVSRIQASNLDRSYTRDAAGQVVEVTNLPAPTTTGITETATFRPNSNQLNGIEGPTSRTYSHDANGNITSDGTNTYFWDALNRLVRVEKDGSIVATYGYDSQNRRIRKTVGERTIHYHYGPDGLLLGESLAEGTPLRDYIYLNGEPLALREYETNPGLYYFLNDHLGTPQLLVTASGTPAWQAAYLPFGQAQVSLATVENNLRFSGQYFDGETGLHYNWHRFYDPSTGRYISADPIGLEGGLNLYAYVENNSINWVDPWGLSTFMCTKPLHGLGPKWGPLLYPKSKWNPSPAYHQFLCVNDYANSPECGGMDRSGSALWSDGIPSKDTWPSKSEEGQCETVDLRECVDDCVLRAIRSPTRPGYGIGPQRDPGDCQEWADNVIKHCQQKCEGR